MWRKKLLDRLRVGGSESIESIVRDLVNTAGTKWSYRLNVWIVLRTILLESGVKKEKWWKELETHINLRLLWEDPKKAPRLSSNQVQILVSETQLRYAVINALMLPSGMRFRDASRIRAMDVVRLTAKGLAMIRIRQTKTIRKRQHQRWLSLMIPHRLLPAFTERLSMSLPTEPLVQVSYGGYLKYIKRTLGQAFSTYSIRRTAFNEMAPRVRTIRKLQQVTLHRTAQQLRTYLDLPMPDEYENQMHATRWYDGM